MTKKTSWGGVAEWYNTLLEENSDTYQAKVILPNVLRVLALRPDEKVIDIACGQGFFTREFKKAGALVVGSDISKELITQASRQSRSIPFHVAPSDKLAFAQDHSYETAVMILALQNIEPMDATFKEAARVLTQNGRLVLVLNHPAFRVPKHSGWQYDEEAQVQYRRIDRYLSGEKVMIDMHPGEKKKVKTVSFHRSLQDISKSLLKNGFAITRLEEWISHKTSGSGPRKLAEDTARKEIPLFLMLEAKKI
jgi:ubiquinone/menaquinone biosynthesis C-methylase UbiE